MKTSYDGSTTIRGNEVFPSGWARKYVKQGLGSFISKTHGMDYARFVARLDGATIEYGTECFCVHLVNRFAKH